MEYGEKIGNVVGATMVFGAVSRLVPRKKTTKRKGGRKRR